ncbi:MAG: ADP-ribose pyrophosphatase [Saprospiraceae bacterium]|jgi:ADP-ribose pyrophosphatase
MQKQWKILRSVRKESLRLFETRYDYLINPRNDKEVEVIVLSGDDAVNIMALTSANKVVMIKQYRFGINDYTIEIPGGLVDAGEDILLAAQRELREETGYSGENWQYLGKIAQNPVFQDAYIHHFLLTGAQKTHPTEFDEAEDIEMIEMKLEDVRKGLRECAFQHPHTVSALVLGFEKIKTTKI